jgi:outer membrane lipoprotein-sorting protein
MRIFRSRPALRWLAPLALLAVIAGVGLVATTASADNNLPPKTAEQILIDMQQARVDGLSGTVTQKANLGIPEIPGAGGSRSSDFNSLVSGSHTLRVWYAGPDKSRIALLGTLGESDVIVNGRDMWTWSSDENEATHRTIDPDARDRAKEEAKSKAPTDVPRTPQEAAQRFLAAVGPSTEVATDSNVTVADRAAYELVLRPRDTRSLITSVRIAVDGEKFVPLRVRVFAAGSEPVAEVGFTKIDFAVPDDAQFAFNPPPGAKVTEIRPGADASRESGAEDAEDKARELPQPDADTRKVVGTGWTTVIVDRVSSTSDLPDELDGMVSQLPRFSEGGVSGRVLAGTAFSVALTDDGRMAAGAVEPELLYEALKG